MFKWMILPLMALSLSCFPAEADGALKIVASFSILADMAKEIGGERVSVDTLVGPEQDAHVFEASPRDAAHIASADIVIVNGLGFEGWMDRLIRSSGKEKPVTIASEGVLPRQGTTNGHQGLDPHAWQNVANARRYASNIADGLMATDPQGAAYYRERLERYNAALVKLDQEIRAAVATIPPDRRKIITTHDAFGYFADAYGIEMMAPVGVSTEAEPSTQDIARIIRRAKAENVPAIFLETVSDPRLMNQIAAESGVKIGGTLYGDALSRENGPAGSYIAMMKTNIRALTTALTP